MAPPMPHLVTVRTPGTPTTDPVTGNETPGPVTVVENSPAWLSQRSVVEAGSQNERRADQNTTISGWTFLCPLSVPLTSASTVTDEDGQLFAVVGKPARRPDHKPRWIAASLRLVSDIQ